MLTNPPVAVRKPKTLADFSDMYVEVRCPSGHSICAVSPAYVNGGYVLLPRRGYEAFTSGSQRGDGSDRQTYVCPSCRFRQVARAERVRDAYLKVVDGWGPRSKRNREVLIAGKDF